MANTTLGNLKIGALRRAGNNYNVNDTTKLQMAGGLINDILGMIAALIKGHPYTLDVGNTVNTVADQAYIALTDTDIVEILQVYQKTTDTKLKQITWQEYVDLLPDSTTFGGVPDLLWTPTQALSIAGVTTWTLYFVPTPSSIVAIYYDYIKSLKFSTDTADAEYCALPSIYDQWIYAEFEPLFYSILDPNNTARITKAELKAAAARKLYKDMIMSQADRYQQVKSRRGEIYFRSGVSATPVPS